MQKPKQQTARAFEQMLRMRRLYSRIGEPLPADVIIDLCRHLDSALLELQDQRRLPYNAKKKKCCPN